MDRKSFMRRTLFAGASCACAFSAVSASGETETGKTGDPAAAFREAWVRRFLKNLEASFDPVSRDRFMAACGRDCARQGATRMAEGLKGNVAGLVEALSGHVGKENATHENGRAVLQYPECYCPMVSGAAEKASGTWCECSRGWVLEMFETAAGKPVQVKLVQSIQRGDPLCRFEIMI